MHKGEHPHHYRRHHGLHRRFRTHHAAASGLGTSPVIPQTPSDPIGNFLSSLFGGHSDAPAHSPRRYASLREENTQASSDSRTAVFDVKARTFTLPNGKVIKAGSGDNFAGDENRRNIGPLPEGDWKVSAPCNHNFHMADGHIDTRIGMALSPALGTNTYGRDHFVIHSTHAADGVTLHSTGCLVVTRKDMQELCAAYERGEFNHVRVTHAGFQLAHSNTHRGQQQEHVANAPSKNDYRM